MECNISDIKDYSEILDQVHHRTEIAANLALSGDIEGAEKEMQQAIDLLKSQNNALNS